MKVVQICNLYCIEDFFTVWTKSAVNKMQIIGVSISYA